MKNRVTILLGVLIGFLVLTSIGLQSAKWFHLKLRKNNERVDVEVVEEPVSFKFASEHKLDYNREPYKKTTITTYETLGAFPFVNDSVIVVENGYFYFIKN